MKKIIELIARNENELVEQLKTLIYCIEGGIENVALSSKKGAVVLSMKTDYNHEIVDDIRSHMKTGEFVAYQVKETCPECNSNLCVSYRDEDTWDVRCDNVHCNYEPTKNVYLSLNELVSDYNIIKNDL